MDKNTLLKVFYDSGWSASVLKALMRKSAAVAMHSTYCLHESKDHRI